MILDAARAGGFGSSGYHRDTTPEIDALAAESLVFENAYSECPSTACSIPNMISGLPFVHRQVADEEWRIADRVETLAESLSGIGYRTIGISANPKNSRARNSDQGFDEFQELWNETERRRPKLQIDPHRLTRDAVETLRSVPREVPLYLQLHYIPPHKPYDPAPEFDLFGDPDYDGIVGPGMRLKGVRSGRIELSAPDVDELRALYDGNLRMGDDAVGRLFRALREADRWDDTVVLVTSDHGEAFFEHGEHGHNTTLYDEMLHVPFVLRLPGVDVSGVDRERLVSLSDVVPTLLGLVGLKPHPGGVGVDLLATTADPDRTIVHRRVPYGSHYAVRGLRYKALFSGDDPPRLFDLRGDPHETNDVAPEDADVVEAYRELLARHLDAVAALGLEAGEAVELPDSDLDALQDLGYVR